MINTYLKAKHWQLFTIIIAIPFVIQIVGMVRMASILIADGISNTDLIPNQVSLSQIFMYISVLVLFGWFWSVAIGLQSKVPESVNMKVKTFKIFYFSYLAYFLINYITFQFVLAQVVGFFEVDGMNTLRSSILLLIPFQLFATFCLLYVVYFIAKTIKTIELQKEVTFSDFFGDFFLVVLWPIGIWLIQPKINSILNEERTTANTM